MVNLSLILIGNILLTLGCGMVIIIPDREFLCF